MDGNRVVAQINDFQLKRGEFQEKLVREMEYSNAYKTTPEAKNEFLQTIIKKELLIQEAKKKGLDKNKEFISAIERYWEATLIKLLLEEKNKEIMQVATVSEKEIKEKYREMKSRDGNTPSFENIEKDIAKDLFEIKKTAVLDKWIKSLYDKADITIDKGFINE